MCISKRLLQSHSLPYSDTSVVLSAASRPKTGASCCHRPVACQSRYRLYAVSHVPNAGGRARHEA